MINDLFFFEKMKLSSRRKFIKGLGMSSMAYVIPVSVWHLKSPSPIRLIVDADTANEVDDLFAIARAIIEPRFKMEGLTSAQWHTQARAPNDTVGLSQKLNEDILELLGRKDIPHPMGSNYPMVNEQRPQPSDAADLIIEKAHETPEGEKLTVATLGPNTNIASAILLDPAIIPKIRCCYIGFWYNPLDNTWNKREFNTNNDPNASNLLLNTPGLEFYVMTATTSRNLVFEKAEVEKNFKGKGGIKDYLLNRWESYDRYWQKSDPEKKKWIMWDVAIIEALANPGLAKAIEVGTPHDNLNRKIHVYTWIDPEAMKQAFWKAFDRSF
jgi:inosine-uridine nucleoside N-ribohydrolase